MTWEEKAEKAFSIASEMGLPSYGTDSLSAEQVTQKQLTGAHRLQASQKHGRLHLQDLENGISGQHENQGVSHKNLYYQLLTKFRSGNPRPVFPHGNNPLALRSGFQLTWELSSSLGHGPHQLPARAGTCICGQLASQSAMICAIQV